MGHVVVVTGAGSGLGRAIARRLARDGHRLVLLGRTLSKVHAVATEIAGGAHAIACDVSKPEAVNAAFAEIGNRFSHVDVLINNAGVFEPFKIAEASNTQIWAALDTNLAGPIFCSRAAIPLLRKGSHIITIGSETVVIPAAMLALYQTSKAGLERFTKSLGQELAPDGIRVTMIRAGKMYEPGMSTPFDGETARRFAEESLKIGVDNRKAAISLFASVADVIPRLLDLPEDVSMPEVTLEGRRA